MNHLMTYNESIFGGISRLSPKRYSNDAKAIEIINEIVDDFEVYDKNLKKVNIIDDNGKIMTGSRINIGTDATLTYIFGKYHPTKNSINSYSNEIGRRKIKINYIPFELVLKKNSLEKAFNTNRINPLRIKLEEEKFIKNPLYNPNISDNINNRGMERAEGDAEKMRKSKEVTEKYKISPDIAGKILKYFIDEYKKQYPEIVGKYKGPMAIDDVEAGVPQQIKYISVRGRDGEELSYNLRVGEDEKEIRNLLKGMNKEEYDIWWKNKNAKLYKSRNDKNDQKRKEIRDEWNKKMSNLTKKYDIKVRKNTSWGDFSVKDYSDALVLEFTALNTDEETLKNKIKLLSKEDFGEYKYDTYRIHEGYSNKNEFYVTIVLKSPEQISYKI